MKREEILAAAKAVSQKENLEEHRQAVEVLRKKGFTWREIADFLTERGVVTDHTRVYRMFGKREEGQRTSTREIMVSRMVFVGEKMKKNRKTWNVLELELPTKFGHSLIVTGFAWGGGADQFGTDSDGAVKFRNPTLTTKSKAKGFPMAYVQAEVQTEEEKWTAQEIYIVPNWEELL